MALILLNLGQTGGDYGAREADSVVGTPLDDETVFVAANGKVDFDPSFNLGGDTIHILGSSQDYRASVDGSNLVLNGKTNGAHIVIPFGSAGANLIFADDDGEIRLLKASGGSLKLGDDTIALSGTTDLTPGADEPGPVDPTAPIRLTVTLDELDGTNSADLFRARVVQNANGEQTNQLGTGDFLDGNGGTDRLWATVQDASPLNAGPFSSIRPETTDVEIAHFTALTTYNQSVFDGYSDLYYSEDLQDRLIGVEINAADMDGLEEVGSLESDSSLTIYNVNTLPDSGNYAQRRVTQDVAVRMDHTGNGDVITNAAHLNVFFDQDYLLRDPPGESDASLTLQLLDIDNQIDTGQPLLTNPFDRLRFGLTVDGVRTEYTIAYTGANAGNGGAAYQALANSINAGLAAAGLTTLSAVVDGPFTVVDPDGDPGGPASGFNIVITNSGEGTLDAVGFIASGVVPPNTDYQKEVFPTPPDLEETLITVDIFLNKVGRGGDGGGLIVGGMDTDGLNVWGNGTGAEPGVEQFILHVEGDSSQPSDLAHLWSTNNSLRVVQVVDEGTADASLTIGNSQTLRGLRSSEEGYPLLNEDYSNTPPGGSSLYTVNGLGVDNDGFDDNNDGSKDDSFLSDLTTFRNLAFKDVLVWNSTEFDNDVELHGHFSVEVVDKYLDRQDTQVDPRADNGNAMYTFGDGDDLLNLNFAQENFAVEGTVTREDFTFTSIMGAGDDHVQLQIGNGYGYAALQRGDAEVVGAIGTPSIVVANWYYNMVVNNYSLIDDSATNPDGSMVVYTESGNDYVELWGSTAATVRLGTGDDVAFTDNSGELGYVFNPFGTEDGGSILTAVPAGPGYVQAFNEAKATWVFNALPDALTTNFDVQDLQSDVPYSSVSRVGNLYVNISFQGIDKAVLVGNTGSQNGDVVTDLKINQAIKDAINNDLFLNNLIEAEDGPGRTLIIRSNADGRNNVDDLIISFATTPLTAQQIAAGLSSFSIPSEFGDRYDSAFGWQAGQGFITGFDSFNVNNNIVEGNTGQDLIVLSTQITSVETIDINGVFTTLTTQDVVNNFTAAVADEPIPEVQTVTVVGTPSADGTASITLPDGDGDGTTTYTVTVDETPGGANPTTPAEIAAALAALINADADAVADASIDPATPTVITLTYNDAGVDYGLPSVDFEPNAPTGEIQDITFGNNATAAASVTITFAGITRTINVDALGADATLPTTNLEIAAAFRDAFNTSSTVSASLAGNVLELTDLIGFNYGPATVSTSSSSAINLDISVATEQDGVPFGLSLFASPVVDGAIPAVGFDIFDVETVLGGPLAAGNFANNITDGFEDNTIALLNLHNRGVAIIDTVETDDFAGLTNAMSEAARLQVIVRSLDTAASNSQDSIIITVDADNKGWFYLVDNGNGAADAVVSHLGTIELNQYIDKPWIGAWDMMTQANFTPLTTEQIVNTFVVA